MTIDIQKEGTKFRVTLNEGAINVSALVDPFSIPGTEDPKPTGKLLPVIKDGALMFHGIDGTNPYIFDNDHANDTPEIPLAFLMQDKGKGNLKGLIIHSAHDADWTFERTQGHWSNLMTQVKGLKNIPAPVKGSTRELKKPSNGTIESTIREDSAGADLIIAEAHKASSAKPLVIFMGGQSSTVANAYLKDNTIAEKVVLFQIAGYWDGGTDSYNTTDEWATKILINRMKYVCVNVKFQENRKYWYDGKDMGVNAAAINSIPAHTTTTLLKKWFTDAFAREGLADSPGFLWFLNNKVWKNFVKKRENGTITTGDDYDFIFITEHDWPAYGATLVNKFKELLSVVPPIQEPPPVVTPPVGGISSGFEEAIRTAGEGRTIVIASGQKFDLPVMNIKNVTIDFNGSVVTPRQAGSEAAGTRSGIFHLTGGKVILRNGVFEGENKGYAAVTGGNGSDVTLDKCKTRNFNFTGTWFQDVTNLVVSDCEYDNTGWADYRYMTGGLMLNDITNYQIIRNKFHSNKNSKGTGIESNLLGGADTKLINGLITNNEFSLSHHNPWNGGVSQNFCMELTNVSVYGLDVSYNVINNEISFALGRRSNGNKTLVHHNTGDLGGDFFFIETIMDDLEVYENNIKNVKIFSFNAQKNGVWRNHVYRNNTITNASPPIHWGKAWFIIGIDGVQNYVIEGNNFPTDRPLVQYQHVKGGVTIK